MVVHPRYRFALLGIAGAEIASARRGHVGMAHQLRHGDDVAVRLLVQGHRIVPSQRMDGRVDLHLVGERPETTAHGRDGSLAQRIPVLNQVSVIRVGLRGLPLPVPDNLLLHQVRHPELHNQPVAVALAPDGQEVPSDVLVPYIANLGPSETHHATEDY